MPAGAYGEQIDAWRAHAFAYSAQKSDEIRYSREVRGCIREHLLEMVDGGLPLRFAQQDVCQQHARWTRVLRNCC